MLETTMFVSESAVRPNGKQTLTPLCNSARFIKLFRNHFHGPIAYPWLDAIQTILIFYAFYMNACFGEGWFPIKNGGSYSSYHIFNI